MFCRSMVERQQPVEEGGDRRQVVLDPVAVGQLQPGRILERLQRTISDLAVDEQQIKLPQSIARIVAFEIVFRPEQPLPAGLALPLGDGAERVEPPRDGREKALLGLHIGCDRPEQRRLRLIGAVGAAKALDRGIGLPSGLQQIVHPQPPVLGRELCVVGAPGAAGFRKHQDAFDVVHERLSFAEIGRSGAVLDDQAIDAIGAGLADDAPGTSGHLRNNVGAKALHNLVERAVHRRQRGEMLDQPVASAHRFTALHRLAIPEHWARRKIAFAIGERLIQLRRKRVGQIIQHIFPRRDVDLDVAPFLGRNLGKPTLHQRLAGRDDLDHGRMTVVQIPLDRGDQRRHLHRGDEVVEEPLLGGFER